MAQADLLDLEALVGPVDLADISDKVALEEDQVEAFHHDQVDLDCPVVQEHYNKKYERIEKKIIYLANQKAWQ